MVGAETMAPMKPSREGRLWRVPSSLKNLTYDKLAIHFDVTFLYCAVVTIC